MLKVTAMGTVSLGLAAGAGIAAKDVTAGEHTETYQGRQIRIVERGGAAEVYIDGRRLHLMKYGEDAYLSAMCHYEFQPSPLAAARQAVEQLRGANLLPDGPGHRHV